MCGNLDTTKLMIALMIQRQARIRMHTLWKLEKKETNLGIFLEY
jgi:hypothetical protein